jgi:ribosomal protein S18 acetylase RimI-like enzyme
MTMIDAPTGIRRAAAGDRAPAIAILTAAFADDPAMRWIYGDGARQRRRFGDFVEAFAGAAFDEGTAHLAEEGGAALWLPPGRTPDGVAVFTHLEQHAEPARRTSVFALFEDLGRQHIDAPHWYLPLIGVVPSARRRGIGTALLREGLARCDRDALPARLEATNAANVKFCRRHGFRISGVIHTTESPPVFALMRPPAAS